MAIGRDHATIILAVSPVVRDTQDISLKLKYEIWDECVQSMEVGGCNPQVPHVQVF